MNKFDLLNEIITESQLRFTNILSSAIAHDAINERVYQRYLSMQYHLTKGVQRYFITAAAHHELAKRKAFRQFLVSFANEEELHYLVAGNDLKQMNLEVLPEPFDVTLWHAYFEKIVVTRPFIRIGAACILENISSGIARPAAKKALFAPFLNRENTKFLVLHQHEKIPHGEQILEAIGTASLTETQLDDILVGAKQGTVLYLRMAEWALDDNALAHLADRANNDLSDEQFADIEQFSMSQIETI